jgi:hypothetical protein
MVLKLKVMEELKLMAAPFIERIKMLKKKSIVIKPNGRLESLSSTITLPIRNTIIKSLQDPLKQGK